MRPGQVTNTKWPLFLLATIQVGGDLQNYLASLA